MIAEKQITLVQTDGHFLRCSETKEPVALWHAKKCAWLVVPEYEDAYNEGRINRGNTAGCQTLSEFLRDHPNSDSLPDISVTWTCDTELNLRATMDCSEFDTEKYPYPYIWSRSWGHLDFIKNIDEAIESLGRGYCDFGKKASRFTVTFTLDGKTETRTIENK